ncbi:hypothetical protein CDAR_276261 [Caerostris darwini]|uniref:Uncharacterized protein n=1 Tax=Caerostris darwini TaxID=1538125 RepID=A0AAV4PWV2_9ARAC|nr:hypothetical protein CDAR_276261 [Caerostris darwini]
MGKGISVTKATEGTKKATAAAALGYRSESLGIMWGLVLGSQSSDWLAAYGFILASVPPVLLCVYVYDSRCDYASAEPNAHN